MSVAGRIVGALAGRDVMRHDVTLRTQEGPERPARTYEAAELRVRHYRLVERLGTPGRLTIDLVTDDIDLDIDGLLAADLELVSHVPDRQRVFRGVVVHAEYVGTYGLQIHLRLVAQPAVALASHTRRSRVFQEMTVVEIATEVLEPVLSARGRTLETGRLHGTLVPRDYCVQFRESDLRFVTRILAEEGITFAFEHAEDDGFETMVLLDDNTQLVAVGESLVRAPTDGEPLEVSVVPRRVTRAGAEEALDHFAWARGLSTASVEWADEDWRRDPVASEASTVASEPAQPWEQGGVSIHAARRVVESGATDNEPGELVFRTGEHAGRVQQRSAVEGAHARGRGQVLALQPGRTLAVVDHPLYDLDGPYAVVESEAVADDPSADRTAPSTRPATWETTFRAIELDTPYVPEIPARPVVAGPLSARVVGPAGDDIHTDALGRIRVRFPWDTHPYADAEHRTSCWIRVGQLWAGKGWGSQFIPRVGSEVLVAFVDGNPDCPVATGCVYNGENPLPFCSPEHKTQSGIRTRSSPLGEGFNELRFEDANGHEEVYLHAQRNLREQVRACASMHVGVNRSVSVDKDQSRTVGGDDTTEVSGGRIVRVGAADPDAPPEPPVAGVARLIAESKRIVSANRQATYTVGCDEQSVLDMQPGTIRIEARNSIELCVGDSTIRLTPDGIDLMHGKAGSAGNPQAWVRLDSAGVVVTSEATLQLRRCEGGADKARLQFFDDEIAAWAEGTTTIIGGTSKVELDAKTAMIEDALGHGLHIEDIAASLTAPMLHIEAQTLADVIGAPLHLNRPGARKS